MALPDQPVTLEVQQIEELARHISAFRHDVNGCLSLIVAAAELIRYNPDVVKRMAATLIEQPPRIAGKVRQFIEECERALGLRAPVASAWHPLLWKRANISPVEGNSPVEVPARGSKNLHHELLQLGKEIAQLGYFLSGMSVIAEGNAAAACELAPTAVEQVGKLSQKFDTFATQFETALQVAHAPVRRLAGGAPAGPVTLSPEHLILFHRGLTNLEKDVLEHLGPLLELSRLARHQPEAIQDRAAEFSQQPPKISAVLTEFAAEFDRSMGIVRATA